MSVFSNRFAVWIVGTLLFRLKKRLIQNRLTTQDVGLQFLNPAQCNFLITPGNQSFGDANSGDSNIAAFSEPQGYQKEPPHMVAIPDQKLPVASDGDPSCKIPRVLMHSS
jgi:hypothetical protein